MLQTCFVGGCYAKYNFKQEILKLSSSVDDNFFRNHTFNTDYLAAGLCELN